MPADHPEGSPERAALEFFALLRKGNYGGMSRSLDPTLLGGTPVNGVAGDLRTQFANTRLADVKLLRVSDLAPAISVVSVQVRGQFHGEPFDRVIDVRLVYRSDDRNVLPRGADGGTWRLVFVPALPTDPLDDEET